MDYLFFFLACLEKPLREVIYGWVCSLKGKSPLYSILTNTLI